MSRKRTNKGYKFFEVTYNWAVFPVYDKIKADGTKGWVGWNRKFDFKAGHWRRLRWVSDKTRGIFEYDEDSASQTFGNREVKGFNLLFHPQAT